MNLAPNCYAGRYFDGLFGDSLDFGSGQNSFWNPQAGVSGGTFSDNPHITADVTVTTYTTTTQTRLHYNHDCSQLTATGSDMSLKLTSSIYTTTCATTKHARTESDFKNK